MVVATMPAMPPLMKGQNLPIKEVRRKSLGTCDICLRSILPMIVVDTDCALLAVVESMVRYQKMFKES